MISGGRRILSRYAFLAYEFRIITWQVILLYRLIIFGAPINPFPSFSSKVDQRSEIRLESKFFPSHANRHSNHNSSTG